MELTDASAAAVTVESAKINTEVTGRIAVTTFDLVFRNPNARVLEGTFVLPLLDGQSVIRFGLDLNGVLREAVPVDKGRGRVVFEEIERRRVDPGLLEQTAGNNYRARIFPIPARGTRHIVVAYQEDLTPGKNGPAYRLNLDFPEPLKNFHLALTAYPGGGAPAQVRTTLNVDLPAWRESRFMDIERTDFTARGLLELVLPPAERPRVLTGRFGAEEYFYAEAGVAAAPQPRPAPRVVGLIWDSSGSGRDRDHAREFALLDAWFAKLGRVEVRLVRLSNHAAAGGTFAVHDGAWPDLRRALDQTVYDGATSLDGLADDPAVDEWLLFSDGLVNFGITPASAKLPLHGAVHAILASPRADPAWLRGFAARHAGEFVNLFETDATRAAERLRTESLRVLGVEHDPEATAQIFPETGTPVTEDTLVVTGILRRADARLRVRLGHNAADARVIDLVVHSGENPSPLAARGWATTKIGYLATDPLANRDDLRRTSREFGIVTAETSLIVLETVADYVRYDIAPPADLRAEWEANRARFATETRKDRDAHLESIVAAFRARIAWWEGSYSQNLRPPELATAQQRRGDFTFGGNAPAATAREALRPEAPADDGIVRLSPFEVTADRESGYMASNTLAGIRIAGMRERSATTGGAGGAVALALAADAAPAAALSAKSAESAESSTPTITLQRWSPSTGYLDRLRRALRDETYATYLEERASHRREPGFYLDVANYFFEQGETDTALKILSNLAELDLEDVALLRVLAHRLAQADRPDLARPLFERVLALRPDEPQSHRDLALVCVDLKQPQRAVDLLWTVVSQPWDARYPEIELIALTELNAIAATCGETLDLSRVDSRLRKNLPVATRVILTWDTNDCDIDLWVTDPNGETAKYNRVLKKSA